MNKLVCMSTNHLGNGREDKLSFQVLHHKLNVNCLNLDEHKFPLYGYISVKRSEEDILLFNNSGYSLFSNNILVWVTLATIMVSKRILKNLGCFSKQLKH